MHPHTRTHAQSLTHRWKHRFLCTHDMRGSVACVRLTRTHLHTRCKWDPQSLHGTLTPGALSCPLPPLFLSCWTAQPAFCVFRLLLRAKVWGWEAETKGSDCAAVGDFCWTDGWDPGQVWLGDRVVESCAAAGLTSGHTVFPFRTPGTGLPQQPEVECRPREIWERTLGCSFFLNRFLWEYSFFTVCVSSRCPVKWISQTCTYSSSFLDFLSI